MHHSMISTVQLFAVYTLAFKWTFFHLTGAKWELIVNSKASDRKGRCFILVTVWRFISSAFSKSNGKTEPVGGLFHHQDISSYNQQELILQVCLDLELLYDSAPSWFSPVLLGGCTFEQNTQSKAETRYEQTRDFNDFLLQW